MKNEIRFTVIGKPYGQKRPRAYRRGKFIGIYSPKENVEYADKIKQAILPLVKNKHGLIYDNVPVVVCVNAYLKKPKITKKQQALNLARDKYPVKKPDGDNILKSILDGLTATKLVWTDDSYVIFMSIDKFYTDSEERVEVYMYEKE
jgi:Holliday junction resolvase RusA-like endonuclease